MMPPWPGGALPPAGSPAWGGGVGHGGRSGTPRAMRARSVSARPRPTPAWTRVGRRQGVAARGGVVCVSPTQSFPIGMLRGSVEFLKIPIHIVIEVSPRTFLLLLYFLRAYFGTRSRRLVVMALAKQRLSAEELRAPISSPTSPPVSQLPPRSCQWVDAIVRRG